MRYILLLVALLMAPDMAAGQSAPKWVSNAPSENFLSCTADSTRAGGIGGTPLVRRYSVLAGLGVIEIQAVTDTKVSFWTHHGSVWEKVRPVFGPAAADTCIFIAAGETKSYKFSAPYVQAVYRTTGTAYFSGE